MEDGLDFSDLEVRAKANAMKQVVTMLQRPDQLNNIELYKKKILRRKATTDALLKDALQVHLYTNINIGQIRLTWPEIETTSWMGGLG